LFHLLKWYLDLVTDQGTVLILYSARIRWGRLRVGYGSLLHADQGMPEREASTIRRVEQPRLRAGVVTWQSAPLEVRGRWIGDAPPICRTLASGADGAIEWTCHMPRARASVLCGDRELTGLGYVESLDLTIPPSALPFRTLRWGRHVSSDHSVVWIDWIGQNTRRWIWLDGEEQPAATVEDSGIAGLAGEAALRLNGARDVRNRPVLASLTGISPSLLRRVAGGVAGMHEHKWLSRSSIVRAGQPLDRGWTLHEVVTR
jgi:hypothetical protein